MMKKGKRKAPKLRRIKQNREYLALLANCSPNVRKFFLKHCHTNIIKAILEIVVNTLKGNANIGAKVCTKLKKYKKTLRDLCSSQRSLSAKRSVLVQKGGFLSVLLPALISGVLSHIFSTNKKTENEKKQ
jgi:hypothetical protein